MSPKVCVEAAEWQKLSGDDEVNGSHCMSNAHRLDCTILCKPIASFTAAAEANAEGEDAQTPSAVDWGYFQPVFAGSGEKEKHGCD